MNTMKTNVWLLSACQGLLNTGNSLLIATSALVGLALAPDMAWATLPLALQFLASMLTTLPASLLMRVIGRQAGFLLGTAAGLSGAGLAAYAIVTGSFVYFCVAAGLFGVFNGFGTFYRFAAADAASADYKSRAISYVMAGGVVAAFVGPNLAHWTQAWFPAGEFAGSYASLLHSYDVPLSAAQPLEADGHRRLSLTLRPRQKQGAQDFTLVLRLSTRDYFPAETELHAGAVLIRSLFTNIKYNPPLPDAHFQFLPPPGADVFNHVKPGKNK